MDFINTLLAGIQSADWGILHAIQMIRTPALDNFFTYITMLGNAGIIWIIIALIFMLRKRSRKFGVLMLIGLAVGSIFGTALLKHLVQRPRPFVQDAAFHLLISAPSGTSFPSGHSLSSFLAAYMICRYDRRPGVPALILAFLIAFSRMYMYVHFPSDVLTGALLGIFFGWLVWKAGRRWAAPRRR